MVLHKISNLLNIHCEKTTLYCIYCWKMTLQWTIQLNTLHYNKHTAIPGTLYSATKCTKWSLHRLIECVISGNTLLEIYYHLPHYYSDSLTFRLSDCQTINAQWYKGNGRGEIVDHLSVYFYIVDTIVQWYIQEMLGPAEQICTQYTTKSLVV